MADLAAARTSTGMASLSMFFVLDLTFNLSKKDKRFNKLFKLEYLDIHSSKRISSMEVLKILVVVFSSQSVERDCDWVFGQNVGPCMSHSGPVHHMAASISWLGEAPREAKSAGFCAEEIWPQTVPSKRLWSSLTRLARKVCHLVWCPRRQANVVCESDQQWIWRPLKQLLNCSMEKSCKQLSSIEFKSGNG